MGHSGLSFISKSVNSVLTANWQRTLFLSALICFGSVVSTSACTSAGPDELDSLVETRSSYWQTVPVYAHLGDRDGLTDAEIEFLASRYDLITLEKRHADRVTGSNEVGTLLDARKLKNENPEMRVLFYWNLFLNYEGYQSFIDLPDDDPWVLKNVDGTPSLKGQNGLQRYDLSNLDFQDWWVDSAAAMVADASIDGVFIDALPQVAGKPALAEEMWGAEKSAQLDASISKMLGQLKRAIDEEAIVIYNGIRSQNDGWEHGGLKYLDHADGLIVEHFAIFNSADPAQIVTDMDRMMAAVQQDKIVILKAFPGFTWLDDIVQENSEDDLYELAKQEIEFPLAAFLIVAGEKSYFNYSWGYRAHYGNLRWYPEFDRRLGEPLGPARKDGYRYWRDYEFASVFVDIESKQSRIDWR